MSNLIIAWFCLSCAASGLLIAAGITLLERTLPLGVAAIVFGAVLFMVAQVSQYKTNSFKEHSNGRA